MEFIYGGFAGLGGIGLVYYNLLGSILTHIIVITMIVMAPIGLITTIRWWISKRHRENEEPGKKWLRTGKL